MATCTRSRSVRVCWPASPARLIACRSSSTHLRRQTSNSRHCRSRKYSGSVTKNWRSTWNMPKPWQNLSGRAAAAANPGTRADILSNAWRATSNISWPRGRASRSALPRGNAARPLSASSVSPTQSSRISSTLSLSRSDPQMWPVSCAAMAARRSRLNGVFAVAAAILPWKVCLNQRKALGVGMAIREARGDYSLALEASSVRNSFSVSFPSTRVVRRSMDVLAGAPPDASRTSMSNITKIVLVPTPRSFVV